MPPDIPSPIELAAAVDTLQQSGIDVKEIIAEWRRALEALSDQADEIDQLRRDLNDANERALGPDERASAAIQLADAFHEWATKDGHDTDIDSADRMQVALTALKLWETVR